MKHYIILLIATMMISVASAQQINDTIKINDKIALPYAEINKNKLVGAVDLIQGTELLHSSDYNVESILAGLAPGLIVFKGNSGPGIDNTSLKVRGWSRGGNNDYPLIVIDGIANRELSSIAINDIQSVQILKDVTAKMLYGSKAANGVIMVNTKRGFVGKRELTFSYEYGIKTPTFLPEYLSSSKYASLYNQARINDGLSPLYTPQDIDAYENNPSILHPNVDYYKEFLKPNTGFKRINAQLIGGDNKTKYFLNLGYVGEDGLENIGRTQKFDRLNVRSNLDFKVTDVVSMNLDIAGRLDIWDSANLSNEELFGRLSSHRPNDYPIWVGEIGDANNFGWSPRVGTNLAGDLIRGGYTNAKQYYTQTNIGMNFNLNKYIKGLSARGLLSFDSFNQISIGKDLSYSRVVPSTGLRIGTDVLQSSESRQGDTFTKNIGLVANVDYVNSWGAHDLQVNFVGVQQTVSKKTTISGPTVLQDDKNVNLGLRTNYTFKDKYTAEISSSYMGSDKFTADNRWGLFGSGGLAWMISNEDFLKNSETINHLKLKSSYGVMGYDRNDSFDYLTYNDYYTGSGNLRTGLKNSTIEWGYKASQIGNENLTFEKSKEFNIGIEGSFFKKKIDIEFNYFNEYRYDIPIVLNNSVPDYTGELKPIGNFNEISNKGYDFFVRYSDKIKEFKYSVGVNFIYSKSVNEVYDEINEYQHQNRTGQSTDAIWGLVANGLYQNSADITNHGVSSTFGAVIPGDIKYENITNDKNDNVIDQYDVKAIGHYFPRINYSLNLRMEYKGVELFVLGQGVSDVDKVLNNSYYWNTGENKYSVQALSAANPASVSGATQPRLTSLNSSHSYRNSTYWMTNGAYFKLRTAEISYSFPQFLSKKIGADMLKLFVRGNDLFTFSSIKNSDPENLNAGITNYPSYRTISMGLKLLY